MHMCFALRNSGFGIWVIFERMKPWLDPTFRKNITSIQYIIFDICVQTNKQTDAVTIPTPLPLSSEGKYRACKDFPFMEWFSQYSVAMLYTKGYSYHPSFKDPKLSKLLIP